MSKHNLNVSLSFTADTSKAKANIADLSKSLQQIAKMPGSASSLFDDTKIRQASQAALELQQHLSKAVNVDTGKLDLSRFSSSLKASNQDLHQYCNTLLNTGKQGQQAFLQLAQAIAAADTPVTRVNKKLAEMGVTLKNTIRWQLSSSMLHGFMSTVSGAARYAEDLNESLNNIRVVTGQNVDQMKEFAVQANRAAKALSTTTTKYTDASLIYYQQGLSDAEVAERTEVTVKMANVARQSAEVVSDQMTAVWNNFYDGSKSLEYYADVMTALGAATATSTDEIAGGLEKFAAIGDTIGLSYEYAAGALATITSNTRQSEEVVGTALKTIFARIQGLNLGDTLEDGTTLNKYSQALDKVGISIFDQNNQIKTMDALLDEMANKWVNISKDQQIALAQTVAGTRQYTQLVALMDNWNNGDNDSMMANLNTINTSSGALDKQADIYAESWEAAENRVKAAAQNIYDSLIDDEFMIDLYNGFEKLLEGVGGFVDGLGGMKGILTLVGSIFMQRFAKEMPTALNNLKQNFMVFTGQAKTEMQKVQDSLDLELKTQMANTPKGSPYQVQLEGMIKVNAMRKELALNSDKLSKVEQDAYNQRIQHVESLYEEAAATAALIEEQKHQVQIQQKTMISGSVNDVRNKVDEYQKVQAKITELTNRQSTLETLPNTTDNVEEYMNISKQLEEAQAKASSLRQELQTLSQDMSSPEAGITFDFTKGADTKVFAQLKDELTSVANAYQGLVKNNVAIESMTNSVKSQSVEWKKLSNEIKTSNASDKVKQESISKTITKMREFSQNTKESAKELKLFELNSERTEEQVQELEKAFTEFDQAIESGDLDQAIASFEKLSTVLDQSGQAQNRVNDETAAGYESLLNKVTKNKQAVDDYTKSVGYLAFAQERQKNSQEAINGNFDQTIDKTYKTSEVITQFGSSLMSLSSVIISFNSLKSVFQDEDATTIEKISATIGFLTSAMSTFNSISTLSTKIKGWETLSNLASAKAKTVDANATNFNTKAIQWNAAALKAHPIFYLTTVIAAVTIAVKGLTLLLDSINFDTASERLESAKQMTEGMADAAEKAKNRYDELLDTINNYDSAIEKIKGLETGTHEFTSALLEANEQAQFLIDKYNLLADTDYYIDENGIVRINQGKQNQLIRAEEENVESTTAMLNTSNILQNKAQQEIDASNLGSDFYEGDHLGRDLLQDDYERLITLIEEQYGSLINFQENVSESDKQKLIGRALLGDDMTWDSTTNKYREDYDPTASQFTMDVYKNFDISKLMDYQNLQNQTGINNQNLIRETLRQSLANEELYQDSQYKNYVEQQVATNDNYEQELNKAIVEISNTLTPDEIDQAYYDALKENYIIEDGVVYNIEDGEKGEKNEELTDADPEDRINMLAGEKAFAELETQALNSLKLLNDFGKNLSEEESRFADALLNKNYSALSLEEITKIQGGADLKNLYPFIQQLDNADELINDMRLGLENWDPGAVDLKAEIDNFVTIKKAIEDLEFGDIIDEETFKSLGEGFDQYFVKLEDGTYRLIADAETFYNTVMGISRQDMFKAIQEGKNQLDYLRSQKDNAENLTYDEKVNYLEKKNLISSDEAESMRSNQNQENQTRVNSLYTPDLHNEIILDSEEELASKAQTVLMTSQTIDELKMNMSELGEIMQGENLSYDSYAGALMNLGSQYENCANEIEKFQNAMMAGDQAAMVAAEDNLEYAISIGEVSKAHDLDAEALENYAKRLETTEDDQKRSKQAALDLAVMNIRLDRGISNLYDSLEDYSKILKNADKQSAEYSDTMDSMKDILADVFNIADGSMLSDNFVQQLVEDGEDLEAIANSDIDTINRLRMSVANEVVLSITSELNDAEIINEVNSLWTWLQDNAPDLTVESHIAGDSEFVTKLNDMIAAAGMTKDQVNSLLGSMGMSASLKVDGEMTETMVPQYRVSRTNLQYDGDNLIGYDETVTPIEPQPVTGWVETVAIETTAADGTSSGGGIDVIGASATPNYSNTSAGRSGGGGGGGGSKKPADKKNKSDVVKRYKEIDDKLASNTSAMNKANAAAEGLWGPERFKNMRKSIDLMEEENELLKERMDLSKQYMEEDRAALDEAAANAGLNFTFNSEGYITNYTEQMTKLYEEQAALIERANADGGVDESEQEQLDAMEKRVNAVTEAIENYEASLEESISDEEKFLENQREIWQANFDLWNEELELEITINEQDLKLLEYFMNKNSDSVFNNAGIEGYNGMIGDYESNTKEYYDSLEDLEKQYANGDIGPEQYKEGIADLIDRALGDAEAMADLKEQLQNRLADEISLVEDELAALNEQFDHLNSVLDHYASIMELTGKSKDFDAMGDIYKSQADNFKNSAEVYQQQYEMYKDEADKYYELMQSAEYGSNEYETYKASWEAAQAASNEAQEQMLSNTEEWAQAMRACIENEFEKIADVLEKSLTAEYGSMDNMITAMERANSLQEEYLTTTNKVYETDKLMRQAQQEIDKTTNSVAKKKLKSYIEETQQLQDQTELSQYELEIQQAKYDLILAEIALEEAQSAKSTVRLQRDAEGNFGYVYTADSEKIAEAEQGLEDAQNRLYNIALEGANDYSQKQMETLQEMYDALKELQIQYLDGEFETEQAYQKAMEDTKKFYYEKLEQYSSLHAVALATDSRVIADAWSSDFNDIIGKTEEWKDAVELYTNDAGKLIAEWAGVVSTALANTGLDDIAKATEEVDKKSQDLRDTIIGEDGESGLVSALEKEIDAISAATKGMIDYQKEIDKAIESNEKLAAQLNEDYKVMPEVKEEPQPEPEETKNNTDDTNKNTGDGNEKSGPSWDKVYSAYQKIISGEWGNGYENRVSKGKAAGYSAEEVQLAQELVNKVYSGLSLQSAKSALGFNTGGYTGAWSGDEGKLAFLHQKELVLNAGDTENFLMSMEVLERILRVIDLQTFSSQFGGLLTSPGLQSQGEQTIEQYITIEANFPEATDRFEIEEAFNSLANLASQYVNRK